jgi:hypothetical protein
MGDGDRVEVGDGSGCPKMGVGDAEVFSESSD